MNFLAHQYLSFLNPKISMGNFMADFVRGKEITLLDDDLLMGVKLHREIDAFTDHHKLVDEAVSILSSKQGKYSSVIIDIYFDYFLANNWSAFSSLPLKEFNKYQYGIFNDNINGFPQKMIPAVKSLTTHDWFYNYKYEYGIKKALSNIERRATFENEIKNAVPHLLELKDQLEPLFMKFFPDLINTAINFFNEHNLAMQDYTIVNK